MPPQSAESVRSLWLSGTTKGANRSVKKPNSTKPVMVCTAYLNPPARMTTSSSRAFITMVCKPTGRSMPLRRPSSAMIVARPVKPPAARPFGTMKASVAKAAMAQPSMTMGRSFTN